MMEPASMATITPNSENNLNGPAAVTPRLLANQELTAYEVQELRLKVSELQSQLSDFESKYKRECNSNIKRPPLIPRSSEQSLQFFTPEKQMVTPRKHTNERCVLCLSPFKQRNATHSSVDEEGGAHSYVVVTNCNVT